MEHENIRIRINIITIIVTATIIPLRNRQKQTRVVKRDILNKEKIRPKQFPLMTILKFLKRDTVLISYIHSIPIETFRFVILLLKFPALQRGNTNVR